MPPTLHILLGIVNKIYHELLKISPITEMWPKSLNLHYEQYHTGMFEGNECKKLLENLPLLRSFIDEPKVLEQADPLIRILESFSEVNNLLFQQVVEQDKLTVATEHFGEAWKASGLNLTTKAHLVVTHLSSFVKQMKGQKIAIFSEQAHEAVHAEFFKTWSRYLVKEPTNPTFTPRLLRAVLDFNGAHGF